MKEGDKLSEYMVIVVSLGFNLIDILSGVACGIKEKNLKSSKLRDGMFKKAGFIFCYILGFVIDNYGAFVGFSVGVPVLSLICTYAIGTELVSIIENISILNPDLLPEKLTSIFSFGKGGTNE